MLAVLYALAQKNSHEFSRVNNDIRMLRDSQRTDYLYHVVDK